MNERDRLKVRKIVVLCLVLGITWVVPILVATLGFVIYGDDDIFSILYVSLFLSIPPFGSLCFTWIPRFYTACCIYEYDGHEIVVFYGRRKRYMKVDGEIVDMGSATLKCAWTDGTHIEAKKSKCTIIFKVNDKLYTREKK
jgi:hypothetical protein